MRYVRVCTLFALLFALCAPAAAQWQVPTGAIPLGRGAGVTGFGSVTNTGTGTLCLLNTMPPTFGACLGGVAGPGSSVLGNIAYWNNTSGTLLGAAPAYVAGNPANASLYSQIANPANGYTKIFNGMQFSQGPAWTAVEQYGANQFGYQQALVGTLTFDPADAIGSGSGVAGYGKTARAGQNAVGVVGVAFGGAAGSNAWGMNPVANNSATSQIPNTGVDMASMLGMEVNVNVLKKPGGVEPTIGNLFGIYLIGNGDSTAGGGFGFAVDKLGLALGTKWTASFVSLAGASNIAMVALPTGSGNNFPSQTIQLIGIDSGGTQNSAFLNATQSGDLLNSVTANSIFQVNNGIGGSALFQLSNSFAGSHARLPGLTVAGALVNDTSGNLISLPGTSSTVLHGGTAPAFGKVVSADMNITATNCTNQFVSAISTGGVGTCSTVSLLSSSPSSGVGYSTGAGCSVTQATSKSTGVTCNGTAGQITMSNASLAAATNISFAVTDSSVAANDVVVLSLKSGAASPATYSFWTESVTAGTFSISLRNFTGGALSEALVFNFAIIKASPN